MAFSSVGFDNSIAEAMKINQQSDKKLDCEISSMLKSNMRQIRRHLKDEPPEEEEGDVDESFILARRIVVKPGIRVEPEILLNLKQLQEQDHEMGQRLLNRPGEGGLQMHNKKGEFNERSALERCAVRALLEEYDSPPLSAWR